MPGDAGTAFVTLLPRVSPGFTAAANAQLGGPLSSLGRLAGGVGLALGASLVAGAAVGGAAIVGFSSKLREGERSIRVATGATGDDLEALGDSFRRTVGSVAGADVEDFATAIGELNTRTGQTGPGLEELTTQAVRLSQVTGEDLNGLIRDSTRVFGDWGIAAEDQADTLDRLFVVSQATGIGVGDLSSKLVAFGAPLRQVGFSMDEAAVLLGKFEKEGVNTELVLGSIRQGLGRMARDGEPAIETFQRVTDEIANAGDASTANATAMELFGARAGPDMAAAIREGRFEIDELLESVTTSGETLESAANDSASFGDRVGASFQRLGVLLDPLGQKVLDFFEGPVLDGLERAVAGASELAAVFEEGGFEAVVDRLADAWEELRPRIADALEDIRDEVVDWLRREGPGIARAAGNLVGSVVDWVLDAAPVFVERLGNLISTGAEWLFNTGLPMLHGWLLESGIPALVDWIQESYVPFAERMGALLVRVGDWIINEAVPFLAAKWVDWTGAYLGWLWNDAIPALLEGLDNLRIELALWLRNTAWPWLQEQAPLWVEALLSWITETAIPWAVQALGDLQEAVGDWIINTAVPFLIEKGSDLAVAALEWISQQVQDFPGHMLDLWTAIGEWLITDAVPKLVEKTADLTNAALDWIAQAVLDAPGKLLELFDGIATWLTDEAPTKIADAADGLFDGIVDALKSVLRGVVDLWNALDVEFTVPDLPGVPRRGETIDLFPDVPVPEALLERGGTLLRDATAMVGEAGPEVGFLPRGATVLPLDVAGMIAAAAIDGAGGRGGGVTIERLEVPTVVDATADEVAEAIDSFLGWTLSGRKDR